MRTRHLPEARSAPLPKSQLRQASRRSDAAPWRSRTWWQDRSASAAGLSLIVGEFRTSVCPTKVNWGVSFMGTCGVRSFARDVLAGVVASVVLLPLSAIAGNWHLPVCESRPGVSFVGLLILGAMPGACAGFAYWARREHEFGLFRWPLLALFVAMGMVTAYVFLGLGYDWPLPADVYRDGPLCEPGVL